MILIGENIHIISKDVSVAIRERNARFLQDLAVKQTEAGVHYLDLNIGPARKNPEEMVPWLVKAIEEVTDLPLSIDTLNPVAMEAGLAAITKSRALINSASGRTDSKQEMMPLAVKYNAELVLSVFTDKGCPPDADSRIESIMETAAYANELGIPNEDLWIDPVLLPISADQAQVGFDLEFMKMLEDAVPGAKSTIGLSNVSNGTPDHLRGILNRTMMVMLGRYNMYSVIADAFDKELIAINNGERPDIIDIVYKVMDEEEIDLSSLSQEMVHYVKTAEVLLDRMLYSDGWLDH